MRLSPVSKTLDFGIFWKIMSVCSYQKKFFAKIDFFPKKNNKEIVRWFDELYVRAPSYCWWMVQKSGGETNQSRFVVEIPLFTRFCIYTSQVVGCLEFLNHQRKWFAIHVRFLNMAYHRWPCPQNPRILDQRKASIPPGPMKKTASKNRRESFHRENLCAQTWASGFFGDTFRDLIVSSQNLMLRSRQKKGRQMHFATWDWKPHICFRGTDIGEIVQKFQEHPKTNIF